jgi:hypothetical protein
LDVDCRSIVRVVVTTRFVLGERLLGDERARQVEVAVRPRAVAASCADTPTTLSMSVEVIASLNAGICAVEPADPSAVLDGGPPVGPTLTRGRLAVREIGSTDAEADRCLSATPVPSGPWQLIQPVWQISRRSGRVVERVGRLGARD